MGFGTFHQAAGAGDRDAPAPAQGLSRWVARRIVDVIGVVLLCAGLMKVWDLDAFEMAVASWSVVPTNAQLLVALCVPTAELALSLLWLSGVRRQAVIWGMVGLISIFTFAFCIQLRAMSPPTCACFQLIDSFYRHVDQTKVVLIRNGILLSLLLLSLSLLQIPLNGAGRRDASQRSPVRLGFTFIESLVVVAVTAIMLAVVATGLSTSRESAGRTKSLTNLRSHVAVFGVYVSDSKDHFPRLDDQSRVDGTSVVKSTCTPTALVIPYFSASYYWNYALADAYYQGRCNMPSFYSPGYPARYGNGLAQGPSTYLYGCTFLADPQYWNPETRTGPSQWIGANASWVSFPSKKVLLCDSYPLLLDLPVPAWRTPALRANVSLVDGSAASYRLDQFLAGYEGGEGAWQGCLHSNDFPFGMHTLNGVRGRDFQ